MSSEAIRADLRPLEEHEAKLGFLRVKLIEGEQSEFTDYSLVSLFDELEDPAEPCTKTKISKRSSSSA